MTELVWEGKYDKDGRKVAPLRAALPFQTVETINESAQERQVSLDLFSRGGGPEWRNRLIWGDKKYVLPALLAEFAGKVDLIYIDPPFATGSDFSFAATIPDSQTSFTKEPSVIEQKAYRDTWGRGLDGYLQWLYEACVVLSDLLSSRGSMYVHLDWRAVHYAKAMLDEVIGADNFKNELVWRRANTHNDPGGFGRIHDTLLYYRRPGGMFNLAHGEYREEYLDQAYRHVDEAGRRYRTLPLHATHVFSSKDDNTRRFGDKVLRPPPGKYWRWSQKKIDEAMASDLIVVSKTDVPSYKKYLDEAEGVPAQSIWDDLKMMARPEMVGYPTQKPETLLERIVTSSSNEGDLVLDCFAGSGTTLVMAERLRRRWIGADLGRFAIHTARKRLLSVPDVRPFIVQNLGKYERQLWQAAEFGDNAPARTATYRRFILETFKATPIEGYAWLHGAKAGRLVHVGTVDAPVTVGDVRQIATEFRRAIGTGKDAPTNKAVDILGWDFAFELNEVARQEASRAGIDVHFWRIPREVLEKRAVEQGDVRFFELAALAVDIVVKKRRVEVRLTDFVIPLDDVPEDVQAAITEWTQWIDYWAIDWDNKGDTFHNEWQTYRTRTEPRLLKEAAHDYAEAGQFQVVVKVIDILGNDTTKTLRVDVT
ncbi:MAG: site-specific DNA-methyltransferase [Candidatus Dormibacteria bacterium]